MKKMIAYMVGFLTLAACTNTYLPPDTTEVEAQVPEVQPLRADAGSPESSSQPIAAQHANDAGVRDVWAPADAAVKIQDAAVDAVSVVVDAAVDGSVVDSGAQIDSGPAMSCLENILLNLDYKMIQVMIDNKWYFYYVDAQCEVALCDNGFNNCSGGHYCTIGFPANIPCHYTIPDVCLKYTNGITVF